MKIISVRENPEYKDITIKYFQDSWPEVSAIMYEDCITHSITSLMPLPQWYLLEKDNEIIGCAGLITNDFISRGDLYPWICALYIDENHRGNSYASLLIDKAKEDTLKGGFENLYLGTDHVGYYEKHGFHYIAQGYHPWDEESRIYGISVK
ncbi:GNAT family N-acetyltransferase [Flavobacterium sp. '19STA2R22 D10 B1']|uniref:GNAT family N-acetyltransferase n=1 Tax=Flavobacterium aerium TaxID=3037261 RepID=UPI00278C5CDC|nr:GNAT family N-acetyltransferase [Flavobacterium sp. '19STA2R22 D10 B1']